MANDLNYLTTRDECECPQQQSLIFYVILGATVVLACINLGLGLVWIFVRRRNVQEKRRGILDEKRRSLADYARPHPPVLRADLSPALRPHMDSPGHRQMASQHVQIMVETETEAVPSSPVPRRRSATALLTKVLGSPRRANLFDKRKSGASTLSRLTVPKSPVSSMGPSPQDTQPPPLPIPKSPSVAPVLSPPPLRVVGPKQRDNRSLSVNGHADGSSGVLGPSIVVQKPSVKRTKRESIQTADSESVDSSASAPHDIHDKRRQPLQAKLDPIPASPTVSSSVRSVGRAVRPSPLPVDGYTQLDLDNAERLSPTVSPLTPRTAPSSLFSGVNAPRALSYVWPRATGPPSATQVAEMSQTVPDSSEKRVYWKSSNQQPISTQPSSAPLAAVTQMPKIAEIAAVPISAPVTGPIRTSSRRKVGPRPMPVIPPTPHARAPSPSPIALASPPQDTSSSSKALPSVPPGDTSRSGRSLLSPPTTGIPRSNVHSSFNANWRYPKRSYETYDDNKGSQQTTLIQCHTHQHQLLPPAGPRNEVSNPRRRPLPTPDVPHDIGDSISVSVLEPFKQN